MKRLLVAALLAALWAAPAAVAKSRVPAGSAPAPSPAAEAGPGFALSNLDASADPCTDFYRFACGGWLDRTEVPPDRSRWGSFGEIEERNLVVQRAILEADGRGSVDPADRYPEKLGAFWNACTDEGRIDEQARADLAAFLRDIDGVHDAATMADVVASLHLSGAGVLFGFGSQQDFQDAEQVIGGLDQGGLGLPDRDYYLKEDGNFPELRRQYVDHVARMLALAGQPEAAAKAAAATVLRVETALAKGAMDRVERRDPRKLFHRLELEGIQRIAPRFPWTRYLEGLGFPGIRQINVAVPGFFESLDGLIASVPMEDWRAYLRWQAVRSVAPHLSRPFVDESFAFYGRTLNGEKELKPRWKRCVGWADRALGEALGQAFVRRTFGDEGKERMKEAVHRVEEAMKAVLLGLPWMDEATRTQALAKLATVANQIGFPDKWRDYDALEITPASHLGNVVRAARFEARRDLAKVGKPLDRGEWYMTPPTVNAYYDPSTNQMVFPAGILQKPFYDRGARTAVNYGAIAMVMGHELTHGFDDQGRRFDEKGNLRDWWSPSVGEEFDRRARCVETQYDEYVAVDDLRVNGKLTLGENIADLGGLKLAWAAFQATRKARPEGKPAGRFTDDQLFFLGHAQAWCMKTRPENARLRATVDPHSPPEHRVNGPLANLPEFRKAFRCKDGARMVRKQRCEVW